MTALIGRALPFLNKLIPAGLAVKGLSKINPKLSNFISSSISAGYTSENVIDYLRDRMSSEGDKMEHNRLERNENSGNLSSQEQVALAKRKQEGKFGKALGAGIGLATGLGGLGGKQEETNSTQLQQQPPPFQQQPPMNPIESQRQNSLQKFKQKIKTPSVLERETERFQNQYGQSDQQMSLDVRGQSGQQTNIDQALLATLEKILKM